MAFIANDLVSEQRSSRACGRIKARPLTVRPPDGPLRRRSSSVASETGSVGRIRVTGTTAKTGGARVTRQDRADHNYVLLKTQRCGHCDDAKLGTGTTRTQVVEKAMLEHRDLRPKNKFKKSPGPLRSGRSRTCHSFFSSDPYCICASQTSACPLKVISVFTCYRYNKTCLVYHQRSDFRL